MKKIALIIGFVLVGTLILYPLWGRGQMNSGMMGGGMMGSGGMGSGTGGNSGMMGSGKSSDRQYSPDYRRQQNPLREDDARSILENYLKSTGNPNLRLGQMRNKGDVFEGEIVTKDDSLVHKILVDKHTGSTRSVYAK
jgi:hypothetical protein